MARRNMTTGLTRRAALGVGVASVEAPHMQLLLVATWRRAQHPQRRRSHVE